MSKKRANGEGTIRQRKVDDKWEARYTVGYDPKTGKQIQKSVYGKTQDEVRRKLQKATTAINEGTYINPSKITLGQWLDIWLDNYIENVKDYTRLKYESVVRVHIKPALGAVKLSNLKTHQIQMFYNDLYKREVKPLKLKSVNDIAGILHRALEQAVILGEYIQKNPCKGVKLPVAKTAEMHPLTDSEMSAFLTSIKGSELETLFKVDLLTGMREAEILALTWDRVDFSKGTILVDRQLMREHKKGNTFIFASPKNSKPRKLTPAPTVMKLLQEQKRRQSEKRIIAGSMWSDGGFPGLVFTNTYGGHYYPNALCRSVKKYAAKAGIENFVFHDMRHTYAVNSLRAGDDVKTLQSNLGHAKPGFTLDRYGSFTDDMRYDSADKMEGFIERFEDL